MRTNELLTAVIQQPSVQQEQGFNYAALETETRILVQQHTNEIKTLIRRHAQDILDIGQKLIEVKQQLGHGNFINWLKFEFNWSISTATRFMRVQEEFKFVNLTNLQIAPSALYLLAASSTPQQARTEALERANLGEIITHSTAQAIVHRYKNISKLEEQELANLSVVQPLKEQTSALVSSQISSREHEILSTADSPEHSPNNESDVEIQSLFEVGEHLCITDCRPQNHTWFGKVAEVKKSTASDIEVVITISLQPNY